MKGKRVMWKWADEKDLSVNWLEVAYTGHRNLELTQSLMCDRKANRVQVAPINQHEFFMNLTSLIFYGKM